MQNMEKYKKIRSLLLWTLLLSFLVFVTLPFKHGGLFRTSDDVQVVRMGIMQKELLSMQFPVRYVNELGNGGGYFLFNFYSPFVYYFGVIFVFMGITLVKTVKIVFLLSFVIGALGYYHLAKKYSDTTSAIVASILFLTSSYLAFDVYFRGALPEVYAFAFLPWVIAFFIGVKLKPSLLNVTLSACFYALMILSHTIIAVEMSFILLLLFITPPYSKKSALYLFYALCLGLCFSAFYLLPSIFEQAFTMYKDSYFATTAYLGNFINPLQAAGLEKIPWSFEPPIVGFGIYGGVCLSIFFFIKRKYTREQNALFLFLFGGFLLTTLLAWDITKPLWGSIIYLRYFQFPYRFLTISTTCGILLTALGLSAIQTTKIKLIFCILLILPAITFQYSYLRPKNFEYVLIYTADDECSTTTWAHEYLPMWTKECFPKKMKIPLVMSINSHEHITTLHQMNNGRRISFSVVGEGGKIIISRYYFPGWQVVIDNIPFPSYPSGKYGLITINVPKGVHEVSLKLTDTVVRYIGNIVSLLSILGIFIVFVFRSTMKMFRKS